MFTLHNLLIVAVLAMILWAGLSYRCFHREQPKYRSKSGAVIEGLFFTCLIVASTGVVMFLLSLIVN